MKRTKRAVAYYLAFSLLLSSAIFTEATGKTDMPAATSVITEDCGYKEYLANNKSVGYPKNEIKVFSDSCTEIYGAEIKKSDYNNETVNIVSFQKEADSASFNFVIPESGMYNIGVCYRAFGADTELSRIEASLKIDGKSLSWLNNITLERIWKDEGGISTDSFGNDIAAHTVEQNIWRNAPLYDSEGMSDEPLFNYFSAGSHTVNVSVQQGSFELYSLYIYNDAEVGKYKETQVDYSENKTDFYKKIEAENYLHKSSSGITPVNDAANASTSPNSPVYSRLNYISGLNYKEVRDWVEWEINVPQDGYYLLDMRVRQNYNSGLSSVRRLTIDGKLPFEECKNIEFEYSSDWYIKFIGAKEPYKFYLKKGKHVVRLTAVKGKTSEISQYSESLIYRLNDLYNSVIMAVGSNPDKYRDYKITSEISGIKDTISNIFNELKNVQKQLVLINGGQTGNASATIDSMINLFSIFNKNPDKICYKLDTLRSNIESYASWVYSFDKQPLDMDYIRIYTPSHELPDDKVNFINRVKFEFTRLINSFTSDYDVKKSFENSLTVWVSTGREQLKELKKLIDNNYHKEHNVDVELALTTDITSAVLAGSGPDVCLFMNSEFPVNFAVRNALINLSEFEDFNSVADRFYDNSLNPFMHKGSCYALPLTESWPMLFVRNDIFDKLNLEYPETWEDMYQIAGVLQRNNLEIGIPSNTGMFLSLLYQNGGQLFDENLNTTFASQSALNAFSLWSSFFSKYSFPLSYDLFNRFRSGQMPIGIADYTLYAQLKAAAPEIRGQWSMGLIPGVEDENGVINKSVCISGATGVGSNLGLEQSITSCAIFKDCEDKKLAWEFIKWFTDSQVQAKYGNGVEAQLGYTGRYASANREVMKSLPWTSDEVKILKEAQKNVVVLNEYPGNYYIAREVNNAFRNVVNNGDNPVDVLSRKNVLINKELKRRQKQFGLLENEVAK